MDDLLDETSLTIDPLDRQIIHVLSRHGRAPMSAVAQILGRPEQTVARRYRRLREAGVMRVIVMRESDRLAHGWFVRMQVRPAAATELAELIARREDVSWVSVSADGEVLCSMRPRSRESRDRVLLERLPRTSQILGVRTAMILHAFVTPTSEWAAFAEPLSAAQEAQLAASGAPPARRPGPGDGDAGPADEPLLELLRSDGRATYAELAAATAATPGQVGRRLEALLTSGAAYLDLEIAHELLGYPVVATAWVTVPPRRLDAVGRAVAEHAETSFVAAVSGAANLFVSIICRSTDELYGYVTDGLGAIDGIQHVELVPSLRRVKQAGTIMEGLRLPSPV